MARLTGTQKRALNPSSSETSAPKSIAPLLRIALLCLVILVPFALPLYGSSQLRSYLPQHLQSWLASASKEGLKTGPDHALSPVQLLEACETHQYSTEIISLDPLVIYINNFTSTIEAEELINIGSPDFASSFISRSRGANTLVTGRTSSSAPLELSHPLVSCILRRARRFMGSMLLPHEPFSVPQLVRYFPGQKYDLHTDFWPEHQVITDGSERLFNRVASFFVFLRANCTEGYTYFPSVEPTGTSAASPASDEELDKWYGHRVARGEIDGEEKGVKFKPIQGNAVFWINLNEKGEGDRRLVHAGLPVGEGEKIGLNIWPRKFYGTERSKKERERSGWSGKWRD